MSDIRPAGSSTLPCTGRMLLVTPPSIPNSKRQHGLRASLGCGQVLIHAPSMQMQPTHLLKDSGQLLGVLLCPLLQQGGRSFRQPLPELLLLLSALQLLGCSSSPPQCLCLITAGGGLEALTALPQLLWRGLQAGFGTSNVGRLLLRRCWHRRLRPCKPSQCRYDSVHTPIHTSQPDASTAMPGLTYMLLQCMCW